MRPGEAGPAPSRLGHPGTPAPTRSQRFRQTLPPVLLPQQKLVPGLTPGTAWHWVATALGAGGSPRTGVGCQHPWAGGFTGLGKVVPPKMRRGVSLRRRVLGRDALQRAGLGQGVKQSCTPKGAWGEAPGVAAVPDCATSGDLSPGWEAAGGKDFGPGTS